VFSASGTMTQAVALSWFLLRVTGNSVDLGLMRTGLVPVEQPPGAGLGGGGGPAEQRTDGDDEVDLGGYRPRGGAMARGVVGVRLDGLASATRIAVRISGVAVVRVVAEVCLLITARVSGIGGAVGPPAGRGTGAGAAGR
jgi:hypothetical protein